jgi:pimeloyl-ACP methyl ester carboxylesterase
MSAISEIMPTTERKVKIANCEIHYREAGSGPPLVHLHGAGGPAWDEAHSILAAHFRVITPGLPGFAESIRDASIDNLPALARVMAGFIKEVVGGKTNLLGSSFGGRVATWVALQDPELVDRLVLESPASFRDVGAPPVEQRGPNDRGVEQYVDPQARTRNTVAIAELTRNNPPEEQLLARIHEIQTPTLVLFGTEDRTIPPETGRLYKERLADCSFALVYQAGHIIRRDRPDAFTRLVSDFLERGPAFLVNRG